MNALDKELIRHYAPAYISAGLIVAASLFQIRQTHEQRKQNREAHALRIQELQLVLIEQTEKHAAWRAAQPNVEDIIAKAREEVGSLDDLRRKMEDPNHVFEL